MWLFHPAESLLALTCGRLQAANDGMHDACIWSGLFYAAQKTSQAPLPFARASVNKTKK